MLEIYVRHLLFGLADKGIKLVELKTRRQIANCEVQVQVFAAAFAFQHWQVRQRFAVFLGCTPAKHSTIEFLLEPVCGAFDIGTSKAAVISAARRLDADRLLECQRQR